MSENLSIPSPEVRNILSEEELFALGQLCVSVEPSSNALEEHDALDKNPNTYGKFAVPFTSGDIPTQAGMLYRQVGLEAVEDLARTGIVRNGATAKGEQHPRWNHRVFWSQGQEGVHANTGDRAVIVAPEKTAAEGWVTSKEVKSIYTKTPDGKLIDLLSKPDSQ